MSTNYWNTHSANINIVVTLSPIADSTHCLQLDSCSNQCRITCGVFMTSSFCTYHINKATKSVQKMNDYITFKSKMAIRTWKVD